MDNTKYVTLTAEEVASDIDDLLGLAGHLSEIQHWAAQAGAKRLAVLAKKLLDATSAAAPTADYIRANSAEEAAERLLAEQPPEFYTVRTWIEAAWCAGYYHAGYTHDSAYAEHQAKEFADHALSGLRGAERQAQDERELPPLAHVERLKHYLRSSAAAAGDNVNGYISDIDMLYRAALAQKPEASTAQDALIRAVISKCKHAVLYGDDLATADERIDDATESIVKECITPTYAQPAQKPEDKAEQTGIPDEMRARVLEDFKQRLAYGPNDEYAVGAYVTLAELNRAADKAEQQAAPTWSFEQRLEAAKAFLARSSDAGMEKLLPYDVQPLIRELAALIGQWQRDASSYPEAPKADGPECGQAEPYGYVLVTSYQTPDTPFAPSEWDDEVSFVLPDEILEEAKAKATPLYAHPPAQQAEPIGEMRESGVVWFKQNPHAYPVGTKFYVNPPAQQQLSEEELEAVNETLKFLDVLEAKPAANAIRALLKGGTE